MSMTPASDLIVKLGALQIELEALGFALDSRGSREAADVALTTSARLGELREDCAVLDFSLDVVRNRAAGSLNPDKTSS